MEDLFESFLEVFGTKEESTIDVEYFLKQTNNEN